MMEIIAQDCIVSKSDYVFQEKDLKTLKRGTMPIENTSLLKIKFDFKMASNRTESQTEQNKLLLKSEEGCKLL